MKSSGDKAFEVMSKFKKPSGAEAKSLTKLFERRPTFDPTECVVAGMQKRKKAAIKSKTCRPIKIAVIMMKKYQRSLPRGRQRQKLASDGKIQTLRVTRAMSSQEIRDKIVGAFKISDYTVLEVDSSGHYLLKACDQNVDGVMAADRRGSLYLCETFKVW